MDIRISIKGRGLISGEKDFGQIPPFFDFFDPSEINAVEEIGHRGLHSVIVNVLNLADQIVTE